MSVKSINFLGTLAGAALPAYVIARVAVLSKDSLSSRMRKLTASIPTLLILAQQGNAIAKTNGSNPLAVMGSCVGLGIGTVVVAEAISASRTVAESLFAGLIAPSLVRIGKLATTNLLWKPMVAQAEGKQYTYSIALDATWLGVKDIVRSASNKFPNSRSWEAAKEIYRNLPKAWESLLKFNN